MKCRHFLSQHCLSCDLLSLEYPASLEFKAASLRALFPDAVGVMKPPVGLEAEVAGSRNKTKLAVMAEGEGVSFGVYDSHQSFRRLEDCPLHAPAINDILLKLKPLLALHRITPYHLGTRRGELKYVIVTFSESTQALMVRFVLRSSESMVRLAQLTEKLCEQVPLVKVVTANIQPEHQAILEGEDETVLTETDFITHHFGDITLYQGPRSFFQTNTPMAHQLYQQFQVALAKYPVESLLDLYCGVGAFSFFARKRVKHVVGVEISEAAIGYANRAKVLNEASDVEFIATDVEAYLSRNAAKAVDAIVVNPPRRGLNASIIAALLALRPTVLFYSSCNAVTLQRDLRSLREAYDIRSMQLFDMFPSTSHFETLAVLTLK